MADSTSLLLVSNIVISLGSLVAQIFTLWRKRRVVSDCCRGVAHIEYESNHEGNGPRPEAPDAQSKV